MKSLYININIETQHTLSGNNIWLIEWRLTLGAVADAVARRRCWVKSVKFVTKYILKLK